MLKYVSKLLENAHLYHQLKVWLIYANTVKEKLIHAIIFYGDFAKLFLTHVQS